MTEELQLDYTELQKTVEELLPKDMTISFQELVTRLMSGEAEGGKAIFTEVLQWLLESVTFPMEHAMRLLFLILFAALFSNLTKAFQKNGASQMGFLCVYLLMALHIASGFQASLTIASEGLKSICRFVTVLLPTYCVSIAFVTGSITAAGYYQGTAFLITVLEYLTMYVLLPMSQIYLLLAFTSCMQREAIFDRLLNLIVSLFSWIQKTLLGVVLAFSAVQGVLCPAIDQLKKSALLKTASVIPGVGNLVGGVWETVMGAGVVLKNAVGIGGVCLLFLIGLLPLCNLGLGYLSYRLVAALTEPVSQDSMEQFLFHAGTAQKLLFQTLFLGMLLFLLLLVVMTRITV